jgi:hypothetical protein
LPIIIFETKPFECGAAQWPTKAAPAQPTRIVSRTDVPATTEVPAVVATIRAAKGPKVIVEAVIGRKTVIFIVTPGLIVRSVVGV